MPSVMIRFFMHAAIFSMLLPCPMAHTASANEEAAISYGIQLDFPSKVLGDTRRVKIYLPNSYFVGSRSYPVVYVLDADFLFEPTVVISKIRSGRDLMPESIIIGVSNSNNAQRFGMGMPKKSSPDTALSFETGKPEYFLDFLQRELIPHIEATYRTAVHRSLVGMSPTNGPVLAAYFQDSPVFDAYIALAADAHFYLPNNQPIAETLVENSSTNRKDKRWLYISRGYHDLPHNTPALPNAFSVLERGFRNHGQNNFAKAEIIDDGEHYASALEGIINAFAFIYPENVWRPDYRALRTSENPADELKAFYQNLDVFYGFKTYPVVDGYWMGNSIGGLSRRLNRQQKFETAIELLEWGLSYYPLSIDLYYYLSHAYEQKGAQESALNAARKSMSLARELNDPRLEFYTERYTKLSERMVQ